MFFSCSRERHSDRTQKEVISSNTEEEEKGVTIELSSPTTIIKELEPQNNKELLWIEQDSILIMHFVESTFVTNQVSFDNYLYFFGEHSEFEIEELLSKYGEAAIEKSRLMHSNPEEYNSLAVIKIKTEIEDEIGQYQQVKLLEFKRKDVDINYYKLKLQGIVSTKEYEVLTNSSDGRSHYLVDFLSKKKSILNSQSYN